MGKVLNVRESPIHPIMQDRRQTCESTINGCRPRLTLTLMLALDRLFLVKDDCAKGWKKQESNKIITNATGVNNDR